MRLVYLVAMSCINRSLYASVLYMMSYCMIIMHSISCVSSRWYALWHKIFLHHTLFKIKWSVKANFKLSHFSIRLSYLSRNLRNHWTAVVFSTKTIINCIGSSSIARRLFLYFQLHSNKLLLLHLRLKSFIISFFFSS